MRSVALLFFRIHLAFAGTHSYQYFCTAVYRNIIPEFTAVGLVDDEQFMYFDNNTMRAVPKTEWIRQNEGAAYWNRKTVGAIAVIKEHEDDMRYIMNLSNQSMSDIYTFQMMFGCEQDDDGTTRKHLQFGYNGEDFITFDVNTFSFIAANPQADTIKNKWEANRDKVEYWKAYFENRCIELLKKYVSYKDSPERKVSPQVSLLQKNSTSPVVCHATSFYPKTITMTWKKNNEDQYEDVEISDTLPNADGTYQKSIILSVKPEEWKKNPDEYRCVIQHVEAEKEIVVLLNENNIKSNSASDNFIVKLLVFITIAIIVGCLLAAAVFAAKKWRKSRAAESSNSTGYMQGSTTDSAL